jgi:hypothetical protein
MPRSRPKVFLSDEPILPDDVLPPLHPTASGDPETEQPYDPIPKRPLPDPDEDEPEPDEEVVEDEDVDDDDENGENAPTPSPSGEPPAAHTVGATAGIDPPLAGREYSAPVGADLSNPPPIITYRSRISVVEAWRYPGQLAKAPDFIDRSWTAWADSDLYGRPAGPALRVPVARSISGPVPPDGTKLCRIGDYVVRQNVTLVEGLDPELTLDVWPKDDFERLFMPVSDPNHTLGNPRKMRKSLADAA